MKNENDLDFSNDLRCLFPITLVFDINYNACFFLIKDINYYFLQETQNLVKEKDDDDEFLFIVKKLSFFLQLNYIRFGGKEISQLFFNVSFRVVREMYFNIL